ncbi:MAG TPA: SPASM domain-containing protein, partial [Anaerolineae bacterium]|nr:SPASM domain-containing protein [Anaerolineae bacterium]
TMICGDLHRQSLDEIWHSTTLTAWRNFRPEPCQGCSAFAICRGGCKAQAFACGLGVDPLLESPVSPAMPQRRQWVFYEQARPVGRFEQAPQHNGTLLLRGNRLALVQEEAHPLLDKLDGRATLQQIEQVHGMAGLGLIASLYEQNLVDLA